MGACTSHLDKSLIHGHSPPIDAIPPDTAFLQQASLPILAFYVLISDIKLKKCPIDRISLRFTLDGIDNFTLPQQSPDRSSKIYWKAHHAFDFYMTEYELRKRFLIVQVMDCRGAVLGKLKLNMFTLWNGPYHLDFALPPIKGGNCRASFNFKISQGIHIRIANTYTQVMPSQEVSSRDKFAYSIEAIIGQQMQQAACPYVVSICEKGQKQGQFNKSIVQKSCIHWQQQQNTYKFDKKIAYYEVYSSSLHLIFYKVVPNDTSPALEYEIISGCFIPFRKLMTFDHLQSKDSSSKITYLQRTLDLTEKTWLHGKEMGKARIKLKFIMQAHLKQMQTGVRTEEGILASSPVFSQGKIAHDCQEITALAALNSEVQRQFIEMSEAYDHYNMAAMKENGFRISSLLAREIALLQKSSKESILFYQYKDPMELMKAQRFLIDFAFKVMTYARQEKAEICEASWTLLTTILKRGEFRLSQVGFSKQQREALKERNATEGLRAKVDVALKYQQLLNYLLKETLILLNNKGEEAQQIFAESFCAYAYFRIPAFRDLILSAIIRQQDPQIIEWRGMESNLYQPTKATQQKGEEFYELHFDWENNFYKAIDSEELYLQHSAELSIILADAEWKKRLGKRSGAFFSFLQNLISEIEYVSVVSKYIKWHHLPGYSHLLRAFLSEFKEKSLCDFTDRMKRLSLKLLSNQRLMNVLVVLLLKKTSINDPVAVDTTMNMINSFFISLAAHQRLVPSTFDYHFFLEGLKMVLESDLQYCISQALLLIYNNLYHFSQDFGLELSLYLLSAPFFKFFFHWSHNLRRIFHLLIMIRIARFSEQRHAITPQKHNVQDVFTMSFKMKVKERLHTLLRMCEGLEGKAKSIKIDALCEKELYKNMRRRLKDKKILLDKHKIAINYHSEPNSIGKLQENNEQHPSKLIYFKEHETKIAHPEVDIQYVREALREYRSMLDQVEPYLQKDPQFAPEIQLRRMVDEHEISPAKPDEW